MEHMCMTEMVIVLYIQSAWLPRVSITIIIASLHLQHEPSHLPKAMSDQDGRAIGH